MFQKNVPLSIYSSYKIGGRAEYFYEADGLYDLLLAVRLAKEKSLAVFVLGGGTNLLIGEDGFSGLVLKSNIKFIHGSHLEVADDDRRISVGAGVLVADLLNFCIENNLSGLEWAGGLPGTIGGAVRGNAGAFGGEIKDTIHEVMSLDMNSLKLTKRNREECSFGYRNSVFKEAIPSLRGPTTVVPEAISSLEGITMSALPTGKIVPMALPSRILDEVGTSSFATNVGTPRNDNMGEIIISVTFNLKTGNQEEVKKAIQEKIDWRKNKHPIEYPNIGSIFKNIDWESVPVTHQEIFKNKMKKDPFPVLPTAVLIDKCQLKGVSFGGAMISPKHPNFIVNTLGATADDVKNLIQLVKDSVKDKYEIELEEEVQYL